jgi:hypothetical protein
MQAGNSFRGRMVLDHGTTLDGSIQVQFRACMNHLSELGLAGSDIQRHHNSGLIPGCPRVGQVIESTALKTGV